MHKLFSFFKIIPMKTSVAIVGKSSYKAIPTGFLRWPTAMAKKEGQKTVRNCNEKYLCDLQNCSYLHFKTEFEKKVGNT